VIKQDLKRNTATLEIELQTDALRGSAGEEKEGCLPKFVGLKGRDAQREVENDLNCLDMGGENW
jgi:hypothetical protein